MLKGVAASPGIGIGKAVVIREEPIEVVKRIVPYVEEEKRRFLDAVEVFVGELEHASDLVYRNIGPSEATILRAQIAIIRDPELTKEVLRSIERKQYCAEYAFHMVCSGYVNYFSHIEDELLSARAADFQDIRDRMLRTLLGIRKLELTDVPEGGILVAEDIPPSQAAGIDPRRIRGIVTEHGTRFSHIAIISRALGLPAVVSVQGLMQSVRGGEDLILDGHSGYVCVGPEEHELREYRELALAERKYQQALERYRTLPTRTLDGRNIGLYSNLALEQELTVIQEDNADGIGLFRTEFLYMERKSAPTEQEQYQVYRRVARAMDGKPVILRTLDIGGDKDIPYLTGTPEQNPFLGHRAVRYCLSNPELFKAQLGAILRAAAHGNVRVMLPMISCITEVRRAKDLIAEVCAELELRGEEHRNVPLGVMIETPAAVMCADDLASEVDFFSIGTNDLTQYVLAVDRGNGSVSSLYNSLHPAVLRMIALTVGAAHRAEIPVGICGEAASDPLMIPFLVGVGVDDLSVSSGSLLAVRSLVDTLSHAEWALRIPEILALKTPDQVRHYLLDHASLGSF